VINEFRDNIAIDSMYTLPDSRWHLIQSRGSVVAAFQEGL